MKSTPERQTEYDAHQVWLSTGHDEGKRLDWSRVDLIGTNLSCANLQVAHCLGVLTDCADPCRSF